MELLLLKCFSSRPRIFNRILHRLRYFSDPTKQLPAGTTPPFILAYSASSVLVLQLALSRQNLSGQELNDYGLNFIRTQLIAVPGASVPYPYGGKQRQVQVDLNTTALQSKGMSALDVVNRSTYKI
jgi:multidrug efflux pump subunit AcrB